MLFRNQPRIENFLDFDTFNEALIPVEIKTHVGYENREGWQLHTTYQNLCFSDAFILLLKWVLMDTFATLLFKQFKKKKAKSTVIIVEPDKKLFIQLSCTAEKKY